MIQEWGKVDLDRLEPLWCPHRPTLAFNLKGVSHSAMHRHRGKLVSLTLCSALIKSCPAW